MPLRMNMRKFIPIIFSILILLILIFVSACLTQSSSSQKTQQDVGITRISSTADSPYISFDIAQQNLLTYQPDSTSQSAAIKTVYTIHGMNVNESGYAASWIFGVRISNVTELLAYGPGGWIKIPYNISFPSEEIDVGKIVPPGRLFSQNNAVILGNPSRTISERRDLDLKQGIYTLTIASDSTVRTLAFNATTGELIT